jgi:DHA3 family macrolide efflux protein-like MFS transporter
MSIANGPIMAVLNAVVAKDMQGRLFSLIGSISSAATPLGLVIAGPTADAVGIRYIYYAAGIGIALIGLVSFFIPSLMNMEKNAASAQPEAEKAK